MADKERMRKVLALLPSRDGIISLSSEVLGRANALQDAGVKLADAVHVAAAEAAAADVLLSCDDRLLRVCQRLGSQINVTVDNPLNWI